MTADGAIRAGISQLCEGPRPVEALVVLSPERLPLVFVELPTDVEAARRLLMLGLQAETSVLRQTERYRRIEGAALERVLAGSRRRELYVRDDPPFAAEIDRLVAAYEGPVEDYAIIPLYGRYAGVMAQEIRLR